jgi:hypothetical protein
MQTQRMDVRNVRRSVARCGSKTDRGGGGARISIPTSTSTKKINYFLTTIDENTIKYGGAKPKSCFFYRFGLQ